MGFSAQYAHGRSGVMPTKTNTSAAIPGSSGKEKPRETGASKVNHQKYLCVWQQRTGRLGPCRHRVCAGNHVFRSQSSMRWRESVTIGAGSSRLRWYFRPTPGRGVVQSQRLSVLRIGAEDTLCFLTRKKFAQKVTSRFTISFRRAVGIRYTACFLVNIHCYFSILFQCFTSWAHILLNLQAARF